ncbi:TlpA family protein [Streptomyces albiaxialis]|uniref:TlpA family protein n=1 Tax=Streptomyces albiaxialis TaxID=329523 RepID=A0ABN2VJQ8_9ACTN
MPFLTAAVVILAVLCLLNLLLTFGIIRKLKAGGGTGAASSAPALMLPNGSAVPEFEAETLDGDRVSAETLRNALVGFVSTSCPACKEKLPHYAKLAERHRALGRTVVTFVHGDTTEALEMAEPLRSLSHVVIEDTEGQGPTEKAFAIEGYPVFALTDATGTLTTSHYDPAKLPTPAENLTSA